MEEAQPQSDKSMATRLASCLAFCGAGHFFVDFACALTVVSLSSLSWVEDSNYYTLVILYNLVAFGSQPLWGWIIDQRAIFREGMTAGILLIGVGAAAAVLAPVVAILFLGCGNALFHVGAGALVYEAAPGRASSQGLFVAPGGLGLLVGIMLGSRGAVHPLWLVPLLIGTALFLYRLVPVAETAALPEQKRVEGWWMLLTVLVLLLSVVAIRSFTGFALPIPWKGVGNGVIFLALASFAGKASGGFLAERYGWRPLCGTMLIIAAVMGVGHNDYLLAACIGVFCLQTTTGVTLAGVQTLFPGRPAFSFGLPCIALLIGALPFLLPAPVGRIHPSLVAVISFCGMIAITGALTIRDKGVM